MMETEDGVFKSKKWSLDFLISFCSFLHFAFYFYSFGAQKYFISFYDEEKLLLAINELTGLQK